MLILLALAACRQLPELETNSCNNGVVERGEDCDLFSQHGSAWTCGNDCRYRCNDDPVEALRCPPGRECGRDGVCRLPAGTYRLADDSPLRLEATELQIADMDGDGIEDLIGGSAIRIDVRYGVGDGTYRESFSLPIDAPLGERTLGDIDGDGVQDLLVPYFLGIDAFLGDRARRLIPDAHPQLDLGNFLASAGALDARFIVGQLGGAGGSAIAFGLWIDGQELHVSFDPNDSGIVKVPAAGPRLATVTIADLTEGSDTDELLVAVEGDDRLHIGRLRCTSNCGLEGGVETGTIAITSIPLGFGKIDQRGAHVVDMDGDAENDLLVLAEGAGEHRVLVFRGNGPSFDPPREDRRFIDDCPPDLRPCWPLAARSSGGAPIFVFEGAVVTSTGSGGRLLPIHSSGPTQWTSAVIDDFDGDGRLDVAAVDDRTSNLAMLFAAGDGAFNRIDVPLPAPARELAAGDFDGDQAADVACVVRTGAGAEDLTNDELHIVFGEASGPVSDPIFMARFPKIRNIQSTFFLSPAPWNPDRVNDLIVEVTPRDRTLPEQAAILVGTARRRMNAPIPLFSEGDGTFGTAYAVRTGRFDGRGAPNELDLMALTLQGEAWVLPNLGGGRFDLEEPIHQPIESVPCGFEAGDISGGCALLETGDVENGGRFEAVISNRSAACLDESGPLGVAVFSIGEARNLSCTRVDPALIGDRTALALMELLDVDGDDELDLVLGFGGDDPAIVVLLGTGEDGDGFADAARVEIPLPHLPIDVAAVGGAQLAILTPEGLSVAKQGEDGALLGKVDVVATQPIGASSGARVIAARIDEDGLQDLVFGAGDRVYIYEAGEGFAGGPALPDSLTPSR